MASGPRIVLVQAPAFVSRGPSNAIALLCAHLRRSGFPAVVHDASLGARRALAGGSPARPAWFEYPEDFLAALRRDLSGYSRIMEREARSIAALRPDIVGFSVLVSTEECSLDLAERVKRLSPGTSIVFGGPQCLRETMARELIQSPFVDAVALGEADRSIVALARGYQPRNIPAVPGLLVKRDGVVVDGGDPEEVEDLDLLPFMDFSGFDPDGYDFERLYLSGSRGCVRKCAFCTHILQQKVFRRMSPARVAAEIEAQLRAHPGKRFVEFGDSLVNGDVRRLAELSRLLVPLRMERAVRGEARDFGWGGMAIIHPTMSAELLRLMRRGGCQTLAYGLESASQRVVDLMRKDFRVEDAQRVIRDTKAAGIAVNLFILVGFPGETEADFRLTLDFIRANAAFIDGVRASSCEIQKGSFLDGHLDDYGVAQPLTDRKRWRSVDGSNDDGVRLERLRAVNEAAQALGIIADPRPRTRVFEAAA